jgi:putative ABC transport system substrate-binding protein
MRNQIRRREFITLLGGAAAAWPGAAGAQQPARVPVIGYLSSSALGEKNGSVKEFRAGLAAAGLIEGRNVAIEFRSGTLGASQLRELAEDLVKSKVVILVASGGTLVIKAAMAAARSTLPVVFIFGGDPVKWGFVESFNRPGGNITGVTTISSVLWGKRLDLLHKMVPQADRIAYLGNRSTNPIYEERSDISAAAQTLQKEIVHLYLGTRTTIDDAFEMLLKSSADALIVGAITRATNNGGSIVALAARHKIPTMYPNASFVRLGGLIGYGNPGGSSRQAAIQYVAPILKGIKPADLPVQQPTKFELALNLKTARALGLEVPALLLTIADEVIE